MPSFTKKAIEKSFLKLLNENPLSQITVKDIVVDCGINRNSFYYHFQDIPTLLQDIIKDEADRIIEENASTNSLEECLDIAVDFALKNKKAVLHIYNSKSRDMYESYLANTCQYVIKKYAETKMPNLNIPEEDKELLIKFFKCEVIGQILEWMRDGMRYDIRDQFHRLGKLISSPIETALKDLLK